MWDKIKNVFQRHTLLNMLLTRHRFYTVKMERDEKVLMYLNRVKQLTSAFKSLFVQVVVKELAMATLSGLRECYEGFLIALDALGNESKIFTFEFVKSGWLQKEQRAME